MSKELKCTVNALAPTKDWCQIRDKCKWYDSVPGYNQGFKEPAPDFKPGEGCSNFEPVKEKS
jgi:hypothetical protein